MNLGCLGKRALSMMPSSNSYYASENTMSNGEKFIFNINFLYQLDGVFQRNNMNHLTTDQKRFMNKFFTEAGKVTDAIKSGVTDSDKYLAYLSDDMKQLDNILAQYDKLGSE